MPSLFFKDFLQYNQKIVVVINVVVNQYLGVQQYIDLECNNANTLETLPVLNLFQKRKEK